MKKIEAVIPHARLRSAFSAVAELNLGGLTYYESKGRGQIPRPEMQSGRGTSTYRPEFNVNAMVVIVVNDSMVDKVVEKIVNSTWYRSCWRGQNFHIGCRRHSRYRIKTTRRICTLKALNELEKLFFLIFL